VEYIKIIPISKLKPGDKVLAANTAPTRSSVVRWCCHRRRDQDRDGIHTMTNRTSEPLSERQARIVAALLDAAPEPGVDALCLQLATAHVCGGTATFLDLEVDPATPRAPFADGPLPVRSLVADARGEPIGENLVWITGGYLSGLEYAWYIDELPAEWPVPDQVGSEHPAGCGEARAWRAFAWEQMNPRPGRQRPVMKTLLLRYSNPEDDSGA
jgi:hypothetical protein